jgi:hypothetical protein
MPLLPACANLWTGQIGFQAASGKKAKSTKVSKLGRKCEVGAPAMVYI